MGKRGPQPQKRPPLTEEQQRTALKYLPLAKSRANRFTDAYNLEIEEIRSVAYEALVTALASGTYDPARGKLATFLHNKITFGIKDWLRENKRRLAPSRVAILSDVTDVQDSFADPQSERPQELADVREATEALLSRTGERERRILRMIFLEEKTVLQVEASVGLRHTRICVIKRDALQSLRSMSEAGRFL